MKKIYITGVSGTGKTTLARNLEKKGFYTISIDEVEGLCSWVDIKTGEKHEGKDTKLDVDFVDAHDWICDIEYLKKLIDKGRDIVFVLGMAGNQNDFLHMFDKIILLECSPETFCKRIDSRTDNDFGKDPEIRKQILGKYQMYAEKMLALGAIAINTEKSQEEVTNEVLNSIL